MSQIDYAQLDEEERREQEGPQSQNELLAEEKGVFQQGLTSDAAPAQRAAAPTQQARPRKKKP